MNCRQAKNLMGAYLYGDLSIEDMKMLRLHTNECEECRIDLESRGKVISRIDTEIPEIGSDDRLLIAEAVRDAIREDNYGRANVWSKLAFSLALGGILLIGFGVGKLIGTNEQNQQMAVKKNLKPTVLKSSPITANAVDKENSGMKNNPNNSKAAKSGDELNSKSLLDEAVRPLRTFGITNRTLNARNGKTIVLDEPLPIVQDSMETNAEVNKNDQKTQNVENQNNKPDNKQVPVDVSGQ